MSSQPIVSHICHHCPNTCLQSARLRHITALHCTQPHCTAYVFMVIHFTQLQHIALYSTVLHIKTVFSLVLYSRTACYQARQPVTDWQTLHCTALHCTALHCTVLYCTELNSSPLHCYCTTLSVQHFCGSSLTECGRTFHRSSHLWSFGQDLTPSTWSHSAEKSITTGCRTPSAAPGLLTRLSLGNKQGMAYIPVFAGSCIE